MTAKRPSYRDFQTRWTRTPAANNVLPQLAVTCKIEAECYYQTFVQVDSEVLRNRQLRQHAKRWVQFDLVRKIYSMRYLLMSILILMCNLIFAQESELKRNCIGIIEIYFPDTLDNNKIDKELQQRISEYLIKKSIYPEYLLSNCRGGDFKIYLKMKSNDLIDTVQINVKNGLDLSIDKQITQVIKEMPRFSLNKESDATQIKTKEKEFCIKFCFNAKNGERIKTGIEPKIEKDE